MKSIWKETPLQEVGTPLQTDVECDIVVVGGGLAGVLTAYRLSEQNQKVVLVEAKSLFCGVTQNTTAHITANQSTVYAELEKSQSFEFAKLYYESQQEAIADFVKIIEKHKIDCDFERLNSYYYTIHNLDDLEKAYSTLKRMDAKVKFIKDFSFFGSPTKGAIKMFKEAMFNPIKFFNGLPKDFKIFTNARVLNMDLNSKMLFTDKYKIHANKIIIATQYPIFKLKGALFLKIYKSHSYAVATENLKEDVLKKVDSLFQSDLENGMSIRRYENRVVIAGLDHRTGRINHLDKFSRLSEVAKKYFGAKVAYMWDANDVVTQDGVPYAGNISKKYKDVYILTGFNKIGMTNSMITSKVVSDMVLNKKNKYEKIFSPSRHQSFWALVKHLGVSIKNLILKPVTPALKSYKKLKPETGAVVRFKGKKKAVYKDINGNLYVLSPYCKHLGCQLVFNPNTKTWDCPCHGSRYDIYGKIITSPTTEPLEIGENLQNKLIKKDFY